MKSIVELTQELKDKIKKSFVPYEEVAGGRQYNTGTLVRYKGQLGVITRLNQGSDDPYGTTVELRLADGTTYSKVPVDSNGLEYFRP